jgi:flavorubredoxin
MSSITQVQENLYVNSVFVEKLGLSFNQFIIVSNENKLTIIETGYKSEFNALCENVRSVGFNPENIECVVVPHFETDEMGAIAEILTISTKKPKVYAHPICVFSLNDIFNANAKPVKDNEVIKIFDGFSLKFIYTKHVHQWDCLVVYWLERKILFSSDLFIQKGEFNGIKETNCVNDMIDAIEKEGYLPSAHYLNIALDNIQKNEIDVILPMHGSGLSTHIDLYIESLRKLVF